MCIVSTRCGTQVHFDDGAMASSPDPASDAAASHSHSHRSRHRDRRVRDHRHDHRRHRRGRGDVSDSGTATDPSRGHTKAHTSRAASPTKPRKSPTNRSADSPPKRSAKRPASSSAVKESSKRSPNKAATPHNPSKQASKRSPTRRKRHSHGRRRPPSAVSPPPEPPMAADGTGSVGDSGDQRLSPTQRAVQRVLHTVDARLEQERRAMEASSPQFGRVASSSPVVVVDVKGEELASALSPDVVAAISSSCTSRYVCSSPATPADASCCGAVLCVWLCVAGCVCGYVCGDQLRLVWRLQGPHP